MITFKRILIYSGLLALMLLGGLTLITIYQTIELSSYTAESITELSITSDIAKQLSKQITSQYNLIDVHGGPPKPETKKLFVDNSFKVYESFHQLETSSSLPEEYRLVLRLKTVYTDFENLALIYLDGYTNGNDQEHRQLVIRIENILQRLNTELSSIFLIGLEGSRDLTSNLLKSLELNSYISISFLGALLISFFIFLYIINKTVFDPTRSLIKATEKVAAGDLDFETKLDIPNEIGTLANSFNEMVKNLRDNRKEIISKTKELEELNAEITSLNQTLEKKVEERTQELSESESYLHNIIFSSPVGVSIYDKNGVLQDCNSAFLNLVGHQRREDCVGKSKVGKVKALSQKEFILAFKGALKAESRRTSPIKASKKGNAKWYVHNFFPYVSLGGKTTKVICYSEDVSDQKHARDLLMAKNKELESFIYTVSHDLKSPLFSISGLLRLLEDDEENQLNEEQRKLLSRIYYNLGKMEQLINDLLDLSRSGIRAERFARFDMNELVHMVFLEEKIRFNRDDVVLESDKLPKIVADEQRISQLFQNLFSNAFKYGGQNKPMELEVSYKELPDFHQFTVTDNGNGIDPDIVDKIFEAFFRIAPAGIEGSGLGLTIVRKIVEQHGGMISAESAKGKGASFCFTLPKILISDDSSLDES